MHVGHSIVATLIAATGIAAAQEPEEMPPAPEGESLEDLAVKQQNPIADLLIIPLQFNVDVNAGPFDDAGRYELRFQPLIPIHLTRDWMVISRTILPLAGEDNTNGMDDVSGLRDTVQSFFLTQPAVNPWGLTWGMGPALLLPTATSDFLGAGKLGVGPTAVIIEQYRGLTLGVLAHHLWSVLGDDERPDVNSTYLQPFAAYTLARTTLAVNTETTYDWEEDVWTVPINATINQLTTVSGVPVQITAGPRWYVAGPMGTADWGVRMGFSMLMPE